MSGTDEQVHSVEGINLRVMGSAPRVIKSWDDRLVEEGVESGVDDEVGRIEPFPKSHSQS